MEAQKIYGTIPHKGHLGLMENGVLNGKKTASLLEFGNAEVAKATDVDPKLVRFDNKMPAQMRDRLIEIATICELVAEYFKGDIAKTAWWFKVSNPSLGGLAPRDLIRLGRYRKLLQFVMNAREAEEAAASRAPR